MLQSLPLRISVLVICFLWTLPTAGLLVTSFRNPQLITKTGWWEGLLNAFQPDQWTLQNYSNVLGSENMFASLDDSLDRARAILGLPPAERPKGRVAEVARERPPSAGNRPAA